jgi:mono/diheme cytochrome c family protein
MITALTSRRRDSIAITTLLLISTMSASMAAVNRTQAPQGEGQRLYRAACAACHGSDGRGQPRTTVGFAPPLPDFTDCAFATPEADADWMAVVQRGGPIRAFDRRMPAFGDALSVPQIHEIISYIRSLCSDRSWPLEISISLARS